MQEKESRAVVKRKDRELRKARQLVGDEVEYNRIVRKVKEIESGNNDVRAKDLTAKELCVLVRHLHLQPIPNAYGRLCRVRVRVGTMYVMGLCAFVCVCARPLALTTHRHECQS